MWSARPLVVGAGILSGCAHMVIGQPAWFAEHGREDLARRGSFDLSCPKEELTFTPLGGGQGEYQHTGVTGCGKSKAYVYDAHQLVWLPEDDPR